MATNARKLLRFIFIAHLQVSLVNKSSLGQAPRVFDRHFKIALNEPFILTACFVRSKLRKNTPPDDQAYDAQIPPRSVDKSIRASIILFNTATLLSIDVCPEDIGSR